MSPCATPLGWEHLVAYWAGDVSPADEALLEEHLMGCADCSVTSARVAAITEALRKLIPPIVTRDLVEQLRAKGLRIRESSFVPGDRREEYFTSDVDVLIFRLGGLDLARAARIEFSLRDEGSGALLTTMDAAPFDVGADALLLCCQRHYASLPPDVIAEVRVFLRDGGQSVATYAIQHRFA
jgi:anti-sigma factor RsiW